MAKKPVIAEVIETVEVIATARGYIGNQIREIGDVFEVTAELAKQGASWFKAVADTVDPVEEDPLPI